jgi:hypothetical protein
MSVSKNDKLRSRLYEDLLDATENAQSLGVPELVWFGISFFTQMAIDCAPSVKDGRKLVKDASSTVRKQAS